MECSELEFKPDWPQGARRLEAWWDCQIVDRAVIQVTAPRDAVTRREIPTPPSLEERWTNVAYVLESAQEQLRATFYGGDAFPCYFPNLGPDIFAGYLGCPIEFGETMSWSVPIIKDWIEAPSLHLDSENNWWKLTLELTRTAVELAPGRFLVGLTDLHGGLDAVAALRDPQNLALDVVDHPDQVRQAVDALIPIWFEVYEGMRKPINPRSPGTTTWLSVWTAGKSYPVSYDFIFMISSAMFREFVLKDIIAETEWLDRSIFHRDGPGALKHLDALLAIPRIQAIQWVPGEKIPRQPMTTWIPLLQRIKRAGKALHLSATPDEVEPLMQALRPEGLLLRTNCESKAEARDLVKWVKKLTPRRNQYVVPAGAVRTIEGEDIMRQPTQADVERFQREGYFAVGPVLTEQELAKVRAAYDRIFAATEKPSTYRNLAQRQGEERSKGAVLQIIDLHKLDDTFRELLYRDDLLDWVVPFVDSPNIRLYHDQALFKPALHGDVVPWHQDNGYWKLEPPTAVSIWIALDNATVENGCMWMIPGSHVQGASLHQRAGDFTAQLEAQADESKAVAIPLPAGSAMFHHCQTLHRTLPNTSPNPRRAFVMHYMAADSRKDGKLMPEHLLLRGESMS